MKIDKKLDVLLSDNILLIEGPLGLTTVEIPSFINASITESNILQVDSEFPAINKTIKSVIKNAIIGVTQGFKNQVFLKGLGYRAQIEDNSLILSVGKSHDIIVDLPKNLDVKIINKGLGVSIQGIDKQAVNYFTSYIRSISPLEPYKGKGIFYKDETIILKKGKR